MGIGAYRHHVTLEHPAGPLDPPEWDCAIQSAANQVTDGLAAFFVRGRYHPGIVLETRILFEGRKLQVLQSVQDVDERHVDLVLLCVEAVARGRPPGTFHVPLTYQQTVLADGASAYWPLDDPIGSATARELVDSVPGTKQGSVQFGALGPGTATAAHFDANNFDAYIQAPLLTISRVFTLEGWARTPGLSSNQFMWFSNNWGASSVVSSTIVASGHLHATVDGNSVLTAAETDYRDNRWHHFVLVADAVNQLGSGATVYLYVDSVLAASTSLSRAAASTQTAITIGGNDDVTFNFWHGELADIAVYPRVLTVTEIAAHNALRLDGRR